MHAEMFSHFTSCLYMDWLKYLIYTYCCFALLAISSRCNVSLFFSLHTNMENGCLSSYVNPSHSFARDGDVLLSVNVVSKLDALWESVNQLVSVMVSNPASPFVNEESVQDDDSGEFDLSLSPSGESNLPTSRDESLTSTELSPF